MRMVKEHQLPERQECRLVELIYFNSRMTSSNRFQTLIAGTGYLSQCPFLPKVDPLF